jgi:regulatory protein
VPDSDGRLAKVSYLFGAPSEPAAPEASRAAHDDASDDAAVSPIGDTAGPAANGRTTSSGWYLEPGQVGADADALSSRDDEPLEEEPEPEAPAIAAARRFLSAVEKPAAKKPSADDVTPGSGFGSGSARAGVRFVERSDESSEEPEASVPKPPPVRRASINALARKGMSSAEMTTLLENREIEPDEVAAEVERLEGAGLLDDRVLAQDLVNTLRDRKGLGKSAITAELRRRQVDQAAIDEALESVDVDDELERATEVAIKRAGQLSSYDRTTAERRLSAFLQRRGYSGTVVGAAVKAALGPAGPRFR